MRIRWKLLIVMLAMILVPILALRWNARSGMQAMGDELAAVARNALIQKARDELQIVVEEHATVLQRERELIEMIEVAQGDRSQVLNRGRFPETLYIGFSKSNIATRSHRRNH